MTTENTAPEGNFDVREALARTLWEAAVRDNPEGVPGESWEELLEDEPAWAEGYYTQADASMRAFDVRPRGTVPAPQISDAEVEAAWQSLLETAQDVTTRDDIRSALEAAREARQ